MTNPDITGTQVESTTAEVGTMHGHRGIQFSFKLEGDDVKRRVTFDFYGNGSDFNGATYARCESAALGAIIKAGLTPESWTHFLIG